MLKKHKVVLDKINCDKKDRYNVLTCPTHESYQSNWANLPHTFYMMQGKGIKPWSNEQRELPANHILLDGSQNQILPWMFFDIALSQNKFGQFQLLSQVAQTAGIPMVSIEHTLPFPGWTKKQRKEIASLKGDINVFISDYSIEQWGFSKDDPSVRVIEHAIDTDLFCPPSIRKNDGKIISVCNDWVARDWCCNFSLYKEICLDRGLPVNPVGNTPGLSEPTKSVGELVSKLQNASVFINTSVISPVPTALLEAMSVGLPVVSTSTCMIPDIIVDGVNGFCSNDKEYLYDRLLWCLNNPEEAYNTVGKNARKTILERFTIEKHLENWKNLFKEAYERV